MFGINQPVNNLYYLKVPMNYYMPPPQTYTTPNPLNFNYPKTPIPSNLPQNNYPKFKQNSQENKVKNEIDNNLIKELEKQILELQELTKEAKELALKVIKKIILFRKV